MKKRVLWVDDNAPGNFPYEAMVVKGVGWELVWSDSVSDAAAKLSATDEEPFSRLILDQDLPWERVDPPRSGTPPGIWGGSVLLWWLRKGERPPSMGFEHVPALYQLEARPPNRDIPVAVFSNFWDKAVTASLAQANGGKAIKVHAKPVDEEVLRAFLL